MIPVLKLGLAITFAIAAVVALCCCAPRPDKCWCPLLCLWGREGKHKHRTTDPESAKKRDNPGTADNVGKCVCEQSECEGCAPYSANKNKPSASSSSPPASSSSSTLHKNKTHPWCWARCCPSRVRSPKFPPVLIFFILLGVAITIGIGASVTTNIWADRCFNGHAATMDSGPKDYYIVYGVNHKATNHATYVYNQTCVGRRKMLE